MFRTVPLAIIRSYSLYTQQWCISYRFVDSFRAGSGWNVLILLLLESCIQTCMIYTIAECTVNNSWWWIEELSEISKVSLQNKFEKLVPVVGFIIRKFVTLQGHMDVIKKECEYIGTGNRKERISLSQWRICGVRDGISYLLALDIERGTGLSDS
jgi:hypothetical protein